MPARTTLRVRDPFIVSDAENGYCLFVSHATANASDGRLGVDCYLSRDLETWTEPRAVFVRPEGFWSDRDFWAPEVHAFGGQSYLFMTFKAENKCRGTQILRAPKLLGPYLPFTSGPMTPPDWECLDGTLWIEDGEPWMVFCHEWLQIEDGTICAHKLSADLSAPVGEPIQLCRGSDPAWARPVRGKSYVTDGPFLHRTAAGALLMIWSGFGEHGYCTGIALSESGKLRGPWLQQEEPLFKDDGGHCMLFKTFDGRLMLALHQPNEGSLERANFLPIIERSNTLEIDRTSV